MVCKFTTLFDTEMLLKQKQKSPAIQIVAGFFIAKIST